MDIGTILGLALAIVAIVGSIMYGGPISIFIDVPSIFVVFGGVIAVTMVRWPMEDLKILITAYLKSMKSEPVDIKGTIKELETLADTARKQSLFALEGVPITDAFLKKAIQYAADQKPADFISNALQSEIDAMADRHGRNAEILEGIAADGPAFGMIGTLIGLVQMLQNMSDPSSIGPAMAVALLTTFYGSCIANVVSNPVANKLKVRSKEEITNRNIMLSGVLGIAAGENPRILKERLDGLLPPLQRGGGDGQGQEAPVQ